MPPPVGTLYHDGREVTLDCGSSSSDADKSNQVFSSVAEQAGSYFAKRESRREISSNTRISTDATPHVLAPPVL
ncbi:hypothetical protein [Allorhodopirellula solitaria]|uniref:hypothetical protein n=1 Tax=Allorhodopirellula solitaria TaxID=2527987 RepID=UPI0011B38749|nr:hypothetical protein [Allorhodopirellula solitaria]